MQQPTEQKPASPNAIPVTIILLAYALNFALWKFVLPIFSDAEFLINLCAITVVIVVWAAVSCFRIPTGHRGDIGTYSGSYLATIIGPNSGAFSNTRGKPYYNPNYPDDWIIYTVEVSETINGISVRKQRYGMPGFENDPTMPLVFVYEDNNWLRESLGLTFYGFYPFVRLLERNVVKRELVPTGLVARKIKMRDGMSDDDASSFPDERPDWKLEWTDRKSRHALISQVCSQGIHPLYAIDPIVIKKQETGGPKEHEDQVMTIDTSHRIGYRVRNPRALVQRSVFDPSALIESQIESVMRQFTAERTIDDIQKGNDPTAGGHGKPIGYSDPASPYQKAILGASGTWRKNPQTNRYELTPGTQTFGIEINLAIFIGWDPGNEKSEKLVDMMLDLSISQRMIQVESNYGEAAGKKVSKYLNEKGTAMKDYLEKTRVNIAPDPNIKVYADGIAALAKNKGTLSVYLGSMPFGIDSKGSAVIMPEQEIETLLKNTAGGDGSHTTGSDTHGSSGHDNHGGDIHHGGGGHADNHDKKSGNHGKDHGHHGHDHEDDDDDHDHDH